MLLFPTNCKDQTKNYYIIEQQFNLIELIYQQFMIYQLYSYTFTSIIRNNLNTPILLILRCENTSNKLMFTTIFFCKYSIINGTLLGCYVHYDFYNKMGKPKYKIAPTIFPFAGTCTSYTTITKT